MTTFAGENWPVLYTLILLAIIGLTWVAILILARQINRVKEETERLRRSLEELRRDARTPE